MFVLWLEEQGCQMLVFIVSKTGQNGLFFGFAICSKIKLCLDKHSFVYMHVCRACSRDYEWEACPLFGDRCGKRVT